MAYSISMWTECNGRNCSKQAAYEVYSNGLYIGQYRPKCTVDKLEEVTAKEKDDTK